VLLQVADQSGQVGPAFAGVGVHLVEHQEAEQARRAKDGAIAEAGEKQFQHDVIGHQDARQVRLDLLAREDLPVVGLITPRGTLVAVEGLFQTVGRIAGVAGDGEAAAGEPPREVVVLGVGQGVHGVDDDGLNA
jgi:hypothetical protein